MPENSVNTTLHSNALSDECRIELGALDLDDVELHLRIAGDLREQRTQLVGLGAAAARNGWAGVVIDGCVRDVAELSLLGVGIRALASMPLPTEKRNQGQRDLAVQLQGVWVRPGDWLYADEDGMVLSDRCLS